MSRLGADALGLPVAGLNFTPVAYPVVVTWAGNTIGTQSGFYIKLPGLLLVWVSFVESAGTANAALTITIPTGYTAVTQTGSLAAMAGSIGRLGAGSLTQLQVAAGATTQVSTGANTIIGVVDTWAAYLSIPMLT